MVRGQWTPVNNPREEYPLCMDPGKNKCPDCPRHDLYYKGATSITLVECVNCGSQFKQSGSGLLTLMWPPRAPTVKSFMLVVKGVRPKFTPASSASPATIFIARRILCLPRSLLPLPKMRPVHSISHPRSPFVLLSYIIPKHIIQVELRSRCCSWPCSGSLGVAARALAQSVLRYIQEVFRVHWMCIIYVFFRYLAPLSHSDLETGDRIGSSLISASYILFRTLPITPRVQRAGISLALPSNTMNTRT